MQPPAIDHASMRETVAAQLRRAVLTGDLRPGARVVEAELASRLGTSRAPVREAIRELVNEGFLESVAYRETRVSTVSATELRDVLVPIRTLAETFALRHLLTRRPSDRIARLHAIVGQMRTAAAAGERWGVIEHDLDFHHTLMGASPFPHPIRVWTSITPVIYRAFAVGTTESTLHETVEGHVTLLRAIDAGDGVAAEALLVHHIEEMELKYHDDASAPEDEPHA